MTAGDLETGGQLVERIAVLGPQRRALLYHRLARSDGLKRTYQLAPVQFGIWLFEQLHPHTSSYHNAAALVLHGDLDRAALAEAFRCIQDRHQPLRSRYVENLDGEPEAVVAPPGGCQLPLEYRDLRSHPQPWQEAARQAVADASTPLELSTGPVWRLSLARCADDEHLLTINLHHIVSDGGSLSVLLNEVRLSYGAARAGRRAALPALRRGYFDVVRTWSDPGAYAADLAYWTERLAGAPAGVALDALAGVSGDGRWTAGALAVSVPADVAATLTRLCAAHRTTLFAGLVAVFAVLLHRVCGQRDIVLTTPVDGRKGDGALLVGCFVNTVALRVQLAGDWPFTAVLTQVREAVAQALKHQSAPFSQVVAALKISRQVADRPFGNVVVVHNNAPAGNLDWGDLRVTRYPLPVVNVKNDLALAFTMSSAEILGRLEYSGRFTTDTMRRVADEFTDLARRLAIDPGAPVGGSGPDRTADR